MNRQLGRLAAAFAVALGVLEAAWATDATWNVDSAGAWTTPGN